MDLGFGIEDLSLWALKSITALGGDLGHTREGSPKCKAKTLAAYPEPYPFLKE